MGNRYDQSFPFYYHRWRSQHIGKFWKRQYNKANRRAWKDERHIRGLIHYASECKWKNS